MRRRRLPRSAAAANAYSARAFGAATCAGCLDGVPGGLTDDALANDMCNATLGDAETLAAVAPAFGTDWMALCATHTPLPPRHRYKQEVTHHHP